MQTPEPVRPGSEARGKVAGDEAGFRQLGLVDRPGGAAPFAMRNKIDEHGIARQITGACRG